MNRNYPAFKQLNEMQKRAADASQTSDQVWRAINNVVSYGRTADDIWEAPEPAEIDNIEMMLNEWARLGDIEPGTYFWGCGAKIEVRAE